MYDNQSVCAADAQRRFAETEGYEAQSSNVLRTLGYFSLIGLLRMHTLLGDYEAALKALSPIHPFRNAHSLTSSIAGGVLADSRLLYNMAAEVQPWTVGWPWQFNLGPTVFHCPAAWQVGCWLVAAGWLLLAGG